MHQWFLSLDADDAEEKTVQSAMLNLIRKGNIMVKFIELHIYSTGTSLLINVDCISYIMQVRGLVNIFLNTPSFSSSDNAGKLRSLSSSLTHIVVKESYSRVKAIIID